jgi:proteasome accessory factor C
MAESPATTRALRLLTMIPFLRERRAISLTELAAAVGSDVATVADDLTVLSLCGGDERDPGQLVGVYVEDGVAQVFADMPALDRPVRLTPGEARALTAALQTIGVDAGSPLVQRLAEFASSAGEPAAIASTLRASFAQGGQAAVIAALDLAAEKGVTARIGYVSAQSGETSRDVRPHALYRWRDTWYLVAHCETAGEVRTFRVDRITSVESTGRHFERPVGLDVSASPLPDLDGLPRACVRFSSDAPDLNDREWPGATFERGTDGSVTASVPYAGTSWIARKVVARLGDAVVLSPPGLRATVAETARELLDTMVD